MTDARRDIAPAEIQALQQRAMELADAAREIVDQALRTGFSIQYKPDGSYVTSADVAVESRLRALIAQHWPDHGVIGEELAPANPEAPFQWVIDPIDGTEDFVHRVPTFGCILALYYRKLPLLGIIDHPSLDLRCDGAFGRGTRRNGERVRLADLPADVTSERVRVVLSARANFMRYRDEGARFDTLARAFPNHRVYRSCLGHTLVATGAADVMVDYHDTLWDLAAARILTEEAGGHYRTVREFDVNGARIYSAVFGKASAVERVCRLLESG
jgi:fructose-1,6-bisphosphatase/inositol monophosphatase family enzyme